MQRGLMDSWTGILGSYIGLVLCIKVGKNLVVLPHGGIILG